MISDLTIYDRVVMDGTNIAQDNLELPLPLENVNSQCFSSSSEEADLSDETILLQPMGDVMSLNRSNYEFVDPDGRDKNDKISNEARQAMNNMNRRFEGHEINLDENQPSTSGVGRNQPSIVQCKKQQQRQQDIQDQMTGPEAIADKVI